MFHLGFEKIADNAASGGHNNQGQEFSSGDTAQNPMVGPGGMAPAGIPSYQPAGKTDDSDRKTKKRKLPDQEAAQFVFGKNASDNFAGTAATGNMGASASPGENAMANSKWDTTTDAYPQDLSTSQRDKKSIKKYKRGSKCS